MKFMSDDGIDWFLEQFGEPKNSNVALESTLKKFENKLPSRLLEYWTEFGFCKFQDGLFFIVNPEDYEDSKNIWLQGTGISELDSFHVIARSAFGSLYLWGEKSGYSLRIDPLDAQIFQRKGDAKWISEGKEGLAIQTFFSVTDPEELDLEDIDTDKPLFKQAVKKFGPLAHDEMFSFEPAFFLGGFQTLKSVSKVNFFIHNEILASMGQREIIDIKGLKKKVFS